MEYTIDGKLWNTMPKVFENEKEVLDYIEKIGVRDYAKSIRLLGILNEI
ncbi:MAG: hypothetical protein ACE5GR_05905 [Nitrosopumilus sp.]